VTQGRTIWLDQLSPGEHQALDPGLPARIVKNPDVLVVGGGMLGVATAAACHAAGLGTVLLIEAKRLASGATGGAAGLLIPEAHQGNDPRPLTDLGRISFARWRQLDAAVRVGLRENPWIALAPHPDAFLADPSPAAQWLDAAEVERLIPGLTPPTTGALIPHQGRLNPVRALLRLAAGLPQIATGCPATAVTVKGAGEAGGGRIHTVTTKAGDIAPGAVVFATGLPPRIPGLPLDLPAGTVKGHLAVTEPVPVTLPGSVTQLGTQIEDHRLLIGGTLDTDDQTTEVNPAVTDGLRDHLARALPALKDVRLTHRWCCWRPRHPDGLGVIDRIPGLTNAWLTSGHYRTGILMAPATADALAHWIATGQPPAHLEAWQIQNRF
jgi:glycine oxidase